MTAHARRPPAHNAPEWVPVVDPVQSLVGDLLSVKHGGTIRILSGEASPFVYNDPRFVEAATRAHRERQASIRACISPVAVADGSAFNGLVSLRERGIVEAIYYRSTRGTSNHFRVVDVEGGYRLYEERSHPPLAPLHERLARNVAGMPAGRVQAVAEECASLFDEIVREASLGGIEAASPPLLLTAFGLLRLAALARQRSQDFDSLDAPALRAMLEEQAVDWCSVGNAAKRYPSQWVLMKIAAFSDRKWPWWGEVVGHSPRRDDIASALDHELEQLPATSENSYYVLHTSLAKSLS